MATWTKNKVNASDVNSGNQFNAGDGVRNTDINKVFESGLYSQDMVENISIGTVTTSASGGNANASVTYNQTTGYPQINLTLPRGAKGEQGEPGSVGTIAELIYNSTTSSSGSTMTTPSFTPKKYLIEFYNSREGLHGSVIVSIENGSFLSSDIRIPYMDIFNYNDNDITFIQQTIIINFLNSNKIKCVAEVKYMLLNKTSYSWIFENSTTRYPVIRVYALNY